ncbi:Uncharacterized protein OBRU01_26644, partial [Operophtera brumata]
MSLLPFLFDYEMERPRRLFDQHFGLALSPEDLLSVAAGPMTGLASREYYRPWRHLAAAARDMGSNIKSDKDKFQVNLDVQHFTPEEISVKTADGYIVVEGKHEEKKDQHGYISRQFTRRYALPDGCVPETVESKLSSDGVLTVTAPRQVPQAIQGERSVPIAQTGPIRKEIKDQANGDGGENPFLRLQLCPQLCSWIKQSRTIRPTVKLSKDKFQLSIDVRSFSKDDIRVKARQEYVIIEGKQEKKTTTGFVMRQFVRKFRLPPGCNLEDMESKLSPDGILTITAPRTIDEPELPCETLIPTSYTQANDNNPSTMIQGDVKKPDDKNERDICAKFYKGDKKEK